MGRKVFITAGMSVDERVLAVAAEDPQAALLWPWLLLSFDDWGRADGEPRVLKARVFPGIPTVTPEYLDQVLALYERVGLLQRYWVDGHPYLAIPADRWYRYQSHIHQRRREPVQSRCPPPPSETAEREVPRAAPDPPLIPDSDQRDHFYAETRADARPPAEPRDDARSGAETRDVAEWGTVDLPEVRSPDPDRKPEQVSVLTEGLIGVREDPGTGSPEGAGVSPKIHPPWFANATPSPPPADAAAAPNGTRAYPAAFERWWALYPRKVAKTRAFKTWRARLAQGLTVEALEQACLHYREAVRTRSLEYVLYPSTFLGPDVLEWVAGVPPGFQPRAPTAHDQLADQLRRWEEAEPP